MATKKLLIVNVDTNDADWIEQVTLVTNKDLKMLRPLFAAIKDFKPYKVKSGVLTWTHSHNFPYGEALREDLGEKSTEELYADHEDALQLFQENYLPTGEYGCHTVESIRLLTVTADEEIL